ncbi:hypothetical protein B0H19DRAFT_1242447 [Mycena capillaripes]|nr:hypothetical protein B0H19DRAFT_1242447 [Mycena capillaripes]
MVADLGTHPASTIANMLSLQQIIDHAVFPIPASHLLDLLLPGPWTLRAVFTSGPGTSAHGNHVPNVQINDRCAVQPPRPAHLRASSITQQIKVPQKIAIPHTYRTHGVCALVEVLACKLGRRGEDVGQGGGMAGRRGGGQAQPPATITKSAARRSNPKQARARRQDLWRLPFPFQPRPPTAGATKLLANDGMTGRPHYAIPLCRHHTISASTKYTIKKSTVKVRRVNDSAINENLQIRTPPPVLAAERRNDVLARPLASVVALRTMQFMRLGHFPAPYPTGRPPNVLCAVPLIKHPSTACSIMGSSAPMLRLRAFAPGMRAEIARTYCSLAGAVDDRYLGILQTWIQGEEFKPKGYKGLVAAHAARTIHRMVLIRGNKRWIGGSHKRPRDTSH